MRQFYLSKNNHGYYSVVFVDPETGWQSVGRSWKNSVGIASL